MSIGHRPSRGGRNAPVIAEKLDYRQLQRTGALPDSRRQWLSRSPTGGLKDGAIAGPQGPVNAGAVATSSRFRTIQANLKTCGHFRCILSLR